MEKRAIRTYRRYEELPPKRKAAFYEQHRADIIRHESTMQYFRKVLNERTVILIKQWTEEVIKIDNEHAAIYTEYIQLRTETQNAESILRCGKQIVKEAFSMQNRRQKQDIPL